MADHMDQIRKCITQFDHNLRVVSLPNLDAMCGRISGMCHKYFIESCAGKYCRVQYSNPDEYGHETPITALFPIIDYCGTIGVILTIDKVQGSATDSEDWQAFEVLTTCPELWRNGYTDKNWRTREEIEKENAERDAE